MFFEIVVYFKVFKFSLLTTTKTVFVFILTFLDFIEDFLVLFYYSFNICQAKINWCNLTNFYFLLT